MTQMAIILHLNEPLRNALPFSILRHLPVAAHAIVFKAAESISMIWWSSNLNVLSATTINSHFHKPSWKLNASPKKDLSLPLQNPPHVLWLSRCMPKRALFNTARARKIVLKVKTPHMERGLWLSVQSSTASKPFDCEEARLNDIWDVTFLHTFQFTSRRHSKFRNVLY